MLAEGSRQAGGAHAALPCHLVAGGAQRKGRGIVEVGHRHIRLPVGSERPVTERTHIRTEDGAAEFLLPESNTLPFREQIGG